MFKIKTPPPITIEFFRSLDLVDVMANGRFTILTIQGPLFPGRNEAKIAAVRDTVFKGTPFADVPIETAAMDHMYGLKRKSPNIISA